MRVLPIVAVGELQSQAVVLSPWSWLRGAGSEGAGVVNEDGGRPFPEAHMAKAVSSLRIQRKENPQRPVSCNLISLYYCMWKHYHYLIEKHPLLTKAFTSGSLCSLGDAITQLTLDHNPFSWRRNVDFFIVGFAYFAPVLHAWYCKILPRIQSAVFKQAGSRAKVMGSMALDQLLFAPVHLAGFFIANQVVVDRDISSFGKGVEAVRRKLWGTLREGWKIWPIATTINLWLMPVQYQVLFVNLVSLFWNIVLSFIAWK